MIEPYYRRDGITLYCGDSRVLLPKLDLASAAIISDPVWPNSSSLLVGADRPWELFAEIAPQLARARRVALHFGCRSDPRILAAMPREMPYIRTCWIEYAMPGYSGRVLNGSEVIYTFGVPIKSAPGRRVIPGGPGRRMQGSSNDEGLTKRSKRGERVAWTDRDGVRRRHKSAGHAQHPTVRPLAFVQWIVEWFSDPDEVVVDPFCGSGTTLLAARNMDRRAIGIEISEQHCATAVRRLKQGRFVFEADRAPKRVRKTRKTGS